MKIRIYAHNDSGRLDRLHNLCGIIKEYGFWIHLHNLRLSAHRWNLEIVNRTMTLDKQKSLVWAPCVQKTNSFPPILVLSFFFFYSAVQKFGMKNFGKLRNHRSKSIIHSSLVSVGKLPIVQAWVVSGFITDMCLHCNVIVTTMISQ